MSPVKLPARERPEVGPAVIALRVLGGALPAALLPEGVPHLGAAEARLEAGIPALAGEPLISGASLLANVAALAAALEPTCAGMAARTAFEGLGPIARSFGTDELALLALAGEWEEVSRIAERAGLEPDAVITLIDHAARPALAAGRARLRELITQLIARSGWRRTSCPACGAPALLAEQRGGGTSGSAEGERVLRCGRCLAAWPVPRLQCPSCGESDHRRLSCIHGAGELEFRRADLCASCHSYIKAVAVLAPLTLTGLLEADLATAALDLSAVDRGFHR
jgi:FdhE protein